MRIEWKFKDERSAINRKRLQGETMFERLAN
jgi:hypothetical protein